LVTSKQRTGPRTGAIALLFSSAVMLFVLLFGGTASADQAADTTNAGIGGANTGVNGAAGNGSGNTATSDQAATATGGGSDAVAPNNAGAGNTSNGTASVTTGDANSTGNSATNNTQQTVVEGHNGAVVIVDQDATITNIGIGISNTGGNIAIGNGSTNTAVNDQTAVSGGSDGDAIASNSGAARNNSGGDARIDTGDASSVGSTSTNTLNQTFDGNFDGGLGVVVLVNQDATVTNIGVGIANTGLNAAIGNGSTNTATNTQCSLANFTGTCAAPVAGVGGTGDSVASNTATASTNSGGSAGIITGDANAVGNAATNNVSQVVNVNAQGALGSVVLIDQNADVANVGISLANTGLNLAVGNLSNSTANNIQGAVSGAGPPASDAIASNDGTATAESNGDASITTGNAEAAGNRSTTNLTQVVDVNTDASGIVLTNQTATVINLGIALANTGGNIAAGNISPLNDASNTQDAASTTTGATDDAVAANFGSSTSNSDGSASIHTGNAGAAGNASTTNLNQTVDANTDGGFALPNQTAVVANIGIGIANTGLNAAIGNVSNNSSEADQTAAVDSTGDDAVASNFGDATTTSDGSADVNTGNANSIGNDSAATTNVAQTVDTDGVNQVLADQSVTAVDLGIGFSNSGLNLAIGNGSTNTATTDPQSATVTNATGDAVASNFGDSTTNSDGSASITTGNANSVGSSAHTNIAQTVDAGDASGFVLTNQDVISANIGIGIANTGLNAAIGNASTNTADVDQDATVDTSGDGDTVAANFGSSSSTSDGSATIHTGNAAGVGSRSTTNVAQTVDANGAGFVMPDQSAEAVNVGIGLANTGGNIAVGNISPTNDSTVDQDATVTATGPSTGDAVASNDGTATTSSNGSAEIWTGSADAIGNDAAHTLNITQTVDANGSGFTLVNQSAIGANVGIGIANTGLNLAVGNASTNTSAIGPQSATITAAGDINGDAVASNSGTSNTTSDGSAKIVTGPANSVGNASTTNITQTSDYDGSGFALVDQSVISENIGIGVSNTGLNLAIGNISPVNDASVDQDSSVTADNMFGDVVSSNAATSNTNSNGKASITTGAATSVGNSSTSTLNQVSDANLTGGGFVIADQTAVQVDLGVGLANTGINLAIGNGSSNSTENDQDSSVDATGDIGAIGDPVDAVSSNTDSANVNSNGSASITTGWADATGNKSTTTLNQVSDADISGSGFVINNQGAVVADIGIGLANTGVNLAIGNGATTTNSDTQSSAVTSGGDIFGGDVVASNTDSNTINTDGDASIVTGAARAIGNDSDHTTVVNQVADSNIGGNGFVLDNQVAEVVNVGVGVANTGINLAVGNISTNTIDDPTQTADVDSGGDLTAGDVVAANTATSETNSDGSASIKTGDAEGVGNKSTTTVNQVADANIPGMGFVLTDQAAVVVNAGAGIGNSGVNLAIGNGSTNTVANGTQDAAITSATDMTIDDGVAANTADLQNNSDGSASITTGSAGGYGNISTTDVNSTNDDTVATGFVLNDQDLEVFNLGLGIGNSGVNLAGGNLSTNTVDFTDDAEITSAGALTADDLVANNTIASGNNSDGSATIHTGGATGYGNTSTTTLSGDSADDATAVVVNLGLGLSNTGLNLGLGNLSTNTITTTDTATVDAAGLTTADDAVANNSLTETNVSDGTVDITTGDAYALGNRSATGIVHAETATTINLGIGLANTGLNLAAGNLSTNTTTNTSTATAPGGVATNTADLSNTSDGTATIHTGNANAFGNIASNATCQGVPFGPTCPQPTLPELPPPFPCLPGSSNCPNTPVPPVNPPVTPPTHNPTGNQPPVLARTGASVELQALLGLLLLALGALLRRRAPRRR